MTRILLTSIALCAATATTGWAQSPPASAEVTVGGKNISIRYSAPSVRGRKIFGDGGLHVPKGTYTLYVWVQDPAAWQLIVSKQTGQWGLSYAPSQDLGRVKMTMAKPPALVERLNYALTDQGSNKVELKLAWEQHVATVPIMVK